MALAQQEIEWKDLHPGQEKVTSLRKRFTAIAAGRRWGKTRIGLVIAVDCAVNGGRVWWVGPNYPIANVGWRGLRSASRLIGGSKVREADRLLECATGGWVQVKSADNPDSLIGEGLDLVIIDEAAHIPKLKSAWEESLRPTLSDRQGGALFISTPKGVNYFSELYALGATHPDWASFQFPTSSNPYIAAKEIEDAKKLLPDLIFRQEYMAEFVQLAGALFEREWFSIVDAVGPIESRARFWDLAASTKASADYTVGARVALSEDGQVYIEDIVRGRWAWPDALKIIGQTARADGPGVRQAIEGTGTQRGMAQLLNAEPTLINLAFQVVEVQTDKMTRCMPWLARAEQGLIRLVRAEWNAAFLDEVCAFPETTHDDQVDAVSGAVSTLAESEGLRAWRPGRRAK